MPDWDKLVESTSMRSAVVLLERGFMIPKDVWRDSSCRRTFMPIAVANLIIGAWKSNETAVAEQGALVMGLQRDGFANDLPSIHPMQGQQKTLIGVFAVSFVSANLVRVTLRGEECARTVGSPRQRTRQIALLRPWEPVRVLVNGRFGGSSGQHYFLREYHLALCSGSVPERVEAPRLVDLQADLF